MCKTALFFLTLLCVSPITFGSEVISSGPGISTGRAVGDVVLGLCCVTATIFILAWIVKKMGAGNLVQQNGMKIISSLSVSAREKIVLVEVDNQKLLLGVAPGAVSRLHVLDNIPLSEKNPYDKITTTENIAGEKWDFSKYLKNIINDGLSR